MVEVVANGRLVDLEPVRRELPAQRVRAERAAAHRQQAGQCANHEECSLHGDPPALSASAFWASGLLRTRRLSARRPSCHDALSASAFWASVHATIWAAPHASLGRYHPTEGQWQHELRSGYRLAQLVLECDEH